MEVIKVLLQWIFFSFLSVADYADANFPDIFQFVANFSSNNESSSTTETPITITTPFCIPISFNNVSIKFTTYPTEVELTIINYKNNDTNLCSYSTVRINISCNSNDTQSWIVPSLNFTQYFDNSSSQLNCMLSGFSEFTNYTCEILLLLDPDEEDADDESVNITFATKEAPPSEPINLNATNITATNFTIIWSEPFKIPTFLLGYNITITRVNYSSENHFWTGCFNESAETISDFTDHLNYTFLTALPDFYYNINISTWSTIGLGHSSSLNHLSTLSAASFPVKDVRFSIIERVNDPQNKILFLGLNLTWEMPCNTNGPINGFLIEINGSNWLNSTINTFNKSYISGINNLIIDIDDINASSQYSLKIYANSDLFIGESYNDQFITGDNYSSVPENLSAKEISANNFTFLWDKPANNPGNISGYEIDFNYKELNWEFTNYCVMNNLNLTKKEFIYEEIYFIQDLFPATKYKISVTVPGFIELSYEILSDSNEEFNYNVSANVTFTPGCLNGIFQSYFINFKGMRDNFPDHIGSSEITDLKNSIYIFNLSPEYYYSVNVSIKNSNFSVMKNIEFYSPSGVPAFNISNIENVAVSTTTTEASLVLEKEYFNDTAGSINYFAIIVSNRNVTSHYTQWDFNKWPELNGTDEKATIYYQTTPKFWNPFSAENDTVTYTIGANANCSENEEFCNRKLLSGKTYFIYIRIFNSNFYRDSNPLVINSEEIADNLSKIGLILGIIFTYLILSLICLTIFILWKKGFINIHQQEFKDSIPNSQYENERDPLMKYLTNKIISGSTTEIARESFSKYCEHLEQHPEDLNKEWQDLETKSVQIYTDLEIHFALLPENRRKNRYTNILPFDHTRVKLLIDEDDEICSDYINSSYINGYSLEKEYIATQGPLPGTARDFWKMVFQENVTIIVMVAKFIENKKEKCFKYFPNNHEYMQFGDDIEVRCTTELNFQIYSIRTLQVQKDSKQLTVTHMQFLEWPDFGIPNGTDNLLIFCHQMRNRWKNSGGKAVVHCSAGVGRTGTIIALDILTQAVNNNRNIDVFNTVLELRKQRKSMVQTEKQYMYIYQLLKSYLEDPIKDDKMKILNLFMKM